VKKKCVSYSYVKNKEKLVIVLREYCIRVNRLFVFQYFSDVFKEGSCEIEESSLGLTEKGKVNKKRGVVSKITNKKAYKL
jgi:hypothetical protein